MMFKGAPTRHFVLVAMVAFLPACLLHRHRHEDLAANVNPGDQPDKILYEKASKEIEKGRYDVGRLTLQTLINTYPDSEYLAKAKLAIADSYYKEGGVSGLTQAEAEYKDFITFFPTAPEAPEAQFRAGMAHFRLMAKYDRDRSEAKQAEAEFKEFLLKYPDSPSMPRVKARLREVQEVLGESDYKTAKFYYQKGAMPAAKSRFQEIADEYPDFSQADRALWYLAQSLERLRKSNEAAPYYARIITDYPLSPLARDAKGRLMALHQPVPRPTKAALARARADAYNARRRQPRWDVVAKLGGVMASSPDVSTTRHGPVQLGKPAGGGVEQAKKNPTPLPGSAEIAVQPLSDAPSASAAGSTGTAAGGGTDVNRTDNATGANVAPAANAGATTSHGGTPQASEAPRAQADSSATKGSSSKDSSADVPPQKKKGKLHFLKKLVPF